MMRYLPVLMVTVGISSSTLSVVLVVAFSCNVGVGVNVVVIVFVVVVFAGRFTGMLPMAPPLEPIGVPFTMVSSLLFVTAFNERDGTAHYHDKLGQ